jgi:hypothetical protein
MYPYVHLCEAFLSIVPQTILGEAATQQGQYDSSQSSGDQVRQQVIEKYFQYDLQAPTRIGKRSGFM